MSNLPGHIEDFKQRTFQSTMDKKEFAENKDPKNHGKGRPHMVINDSNAADKLVQDAIDDTGCNYVN